MNADKAAAIERLNARIKLNEERIDRGEYNSSKLRDWNKRLAARVAELEKETNR